MATVLTPTVATTETTQPALVWRTPEELREIAEREPTNPMPLYMLAHVLRRHGDPSWEAAATAASQRSHATPQRFYARAITQILYGDWNGWSALDSRLHEPGTIRDLSPFGEVCWKRQRWDGQEDLRDKSLLILPEQGHGDCLQMWRFMPPLLEVVGQPILTVYSRLVPLARHVFGSRCKLVLYDIKTSIPADRYVWALSLPGIFGALPPFTPLNPPRRRPRIPRPEGRLQAGVCWAGEPGYQQDSERSMPISELAPVFSRPEIDWHSLQVGTRAVDADRYPTLRKPDPPLINYADTADLMAQLDFVVTVDTSVAHLAGLLGVPTYLLLQLDSHWRWGLRDTTPWYPSIRLIRQSVLGDWTSAVRELSTLLDERPLLAEVA
jgi:hypothetical protein